MTRRSWLVSCVLGVAASTAPLGCALRRPETTPLRTIEPQLGEGPAPHGQSVSGADIRLLDTQARAHIGRRLLHQLAQGELIEDPVWRWSSGPDRYLDTALRLEFAANRATRLVDAVDAAVLAVTLLAWQIEGEGSARLLAAIELRFIGTDRAVRTHVIRDTEPVSGGLPGDLSIAAGRLLGRLASEACKKVTAITLASNQGSPTALRR